MEVSLTMVNNPTIDNYVEVIHALARHTHMLPDGDRPHTRVDNPSLHEKANPPEFLRLYVPRKSTENFKLIDTVHALGLQVGDIWQLERQYEAEVIAFKVEPRPDGDDESNE